MKQKLERKKLKIIVATLGLENCVMRLPQDCRGEQISVSTEITNETEGIRLLWVGFSVLGNNSVEDLGYFGLISWLSAKFFSNRTDRKTD